MDVHAGVSRRALGADVGLAARGEGHGQQERRELRR
jgi:hypothetical protein